MATNMHVEIDRARIKELTAREATRLDERTQASARMYERARETLSGGVASSYQCATRGRSTSSAAKGRRSGTSTATSRSTSTTASARWSRATPTRRSPGGDRAARARHPLRRADRGRDRRRRGARAALGAAALALRQLRLRGDDGRHPDRPGEDRPRDDRQDLRLLPRPPRLRDGLDRRRLRQDRGPGEPRLAAVRRRASRSRSST